MGHKNILRLISTFTDDSGLISTWDFREEDQGLLQEEDGKECPLYHPDGTDLRKIENKNS